MVANGAQGAQDCVRSVGTSLVIGPRLCMKCTTNARSREANSGAPHFRCLHSVVLPSPPCPPSRRLSIGQDLQIFCGKTSGSLGIRYFSAFRRVIRLSYSRNTLVEFIDCIRISAHRTFPSKIRHFSACIQPLGNHATPWILTNALRHPLDYRQGGPRLMPRPTPCQIITLGPRSDAGAGHWAARHRNKGPNQEHARPR